MSTPVKACVRETEDSITLQIELMNDRTVSLDYWKNGDPPTVSIWTDVTEYEFGDETLEVFEDFAKIAVGEMKPSQERQWLCQVCKDQQGFGPMLPDKIWAAITPTPHRGLMCFECMQKRTATVLGRKLYFDSARGGKLRISRHRRRRTRSKHAAQLDLLAGTSP